MYTLQNLQGNILGDSPILQVNSQFSNVSSVFQPDLFQNSLFLNQHISLNEVPSSGVVPNYPLHVYGAAATPDCPLQFQVPLNIFPTTEQIVQTVKESQPLYSNVCTDVLPVEEASNMIFQPETTAVDSSQSKSADSNKLLDLATVPSCVPTRSESITQLDDSHKETSSKMICDEAETSSHNNCKSAEIDESETINQAVCSSLQSEEQHSSAINFPSKGLFSKWRRVEIIGLKCLIYYYPPFGRKKLKSRRAVKSYCQRNHIEYKAEMFDFRKSISFFDFETQIKESSKVDVLKDIFEKGSIAEQDYYSLEANVRKKFEPSVIVAPLHLEKETGQKEKLHENVVACSARSNQRKRRRPVVIDL